MNVAYIGAAVRHILTLLAGYLLGEGAVSEPEISSISAAIATIIAVGWSWYRKHEDKVKLEGAESEKV